MTSRAFVVLCLSLSTALASHVEINAKDINSSNNKLEATHDVVAFVNNSIVKASHAHYDKNTTKMRLEGDVNIVEYDGKNIIADIVETNSQAKTSQYEDAFIVTQEDFWLYSDKINRNGNQYKFGKSIFSSCAIKNPDWIIGWERS